MGLLNTMEAPHQPVNISPPQMEDILQPGGNVFRGKDGELDGELEKSMRTSA